jgi:hypothetical protein
MKKINIIILLLILFAMCANGQNEKALENPDEQVIVNKQYDEDGNLIAFDSMHVRKWSADTLQYLFEKDLFAGNMLPDMEKLMERFMSDSAFQHFNFPEPFLGSPFSDEDLFKRFEHSLPDSALTREFSFQMDSIPFSHEFILPDMKELQKQMDEHFKIFNFPKPQMEEKLTDKQKKELEELLKKHQKEMEELRKKWKETR